MPDDLLTTAEAAKRLRITPRRVRQIADAKELGRMVGGIWLFTAAELREMRRRLRKPGRPVGS